MEWLAKHGIDRVDILLFFIAIAAMVYLLRSIIRPPHRLRDNRQDSVRFIIVAVVGLGATITGALYDTYRRRDKPHGTEQIAKLDAIQQSLRGLNTYIERQKQEIRDADATVAALRSQRAALEPLVKTDRELVEKILTTAETARSRNVWSERIVSFLLGVLSSAVVAGAMKFIELKRNRQNSFKPPLEPG